MNQMKVEAALERLRLHCENKNLRLTPLRQLVYRCLLLGGKVGAYDLLRLVRQHKPATKPMSIYRVLDFLQQQSFIHRLDASRRYVACHLSEGHGGTVSLLLECLSCERMQELHLAAPASQQIVGQLRSIGYDSGNGVLQMQAMCNACSENTASNSAS